MGMCAVHLPLSFSPHSWSPQCSGPLIQKLQLHTIFSNHILIFQEWKSRHWNCQFTGSGGINRISEGIWLPTAHTQRKVCTVNLDTKSVRKWCGLRSQTSTAWQNPQRVSCHGFTREIAYRSKRRFFWRNYLRRQAGREKIWFVIRNTTLVQMKMFEKRRRSFQKDK